jgi:lysyl-tRNA synthetase, class II
MYVDQIVVSGRQPALLMLLAMIVTFIVVRVITRMIREGKWGLHNIAPGGLHIHHVVFGVVAMLLAGIVGIAFRLTEPGLDVVAVVFGIGAALTVDEFALLLHLEDVYWSVEGRQSVDAMVVMVLFTALLITGIAPLGITSDPGTLGQLTVVMTIGVNVVFVAITLLKGKPATGVLGFFFPPIAIVGSIRLAHPTSPWARLRYTRDPMKMSRAQARSGEAHWMLRLRDRLWNRIGLGGGPSNK